MSYVYVYVYVNLMYLFVLRIFRNVEVAVPRGILATDLAFLFGPYPRGVG